MSQKTILVTAANGNVGSRLAKRLLDQGFKVNALVRNTESNVARDLEQHGDNIFKGDFDDIALLEKASQGIWGVLLWPSAKMNSQILVHNMNATHTGNPNTVRRRHSKKLGLTTGQSFVQKQHLIMSPLPELIDPDDIANYAAAAFADPDIFNGLAIDLANEDITLKDFGKLITDITGVQITVDHVSKEEAVAHGMPSSASVWYDCAKAVNYPIDYEQLEQLPVKRITVAEYLKEEQGFHY
ncbi:hypothetical protein BGW37DRAFT_541592 [Umbelopsis sp. PMI_123]|nr:hypothetical protein BGW37DRAFT_541592 [Umbelopsis sp. PMI_123]